jgi:copper chaperone CopZ
MGTDQQNLAPILGGEVGESSSRVRGFAFTTPYTFTLFPFVGRCTEDTMTPLRIFPVVALLAALLSSTTVADDKPAKAEQFTYRVLGLFSPDREKDLRTAFEDLTDFKLIKVNFDDAEITVEFAPAKLFPGQKPERVVELVNDKVRAATHYTFGVKPRRTTPRDKLQQVEIPAAGLDCKACCLAAYEAISGIDGVEQATASFKEGRITALVDPTKTDRAKLEDALRKKGVELGKPAKP